ncbi:MAG TPA: hypothetical protein EYQ50_29340 [Verrucomicrobiales bacterium]|nr:hypothetical protein [Verrucomicrobiales bacterium]
MPPFYFSALGLDLRFARMLRLLRVLRLAKLGRYHHSLEVIISVLKKNKEELVLTTAFMGMLLIGSSCLLYIAEHEAQPEKFESIPAAMWWSIATLTTVGYGDVAPITPLGKLFASMVAVLGIGMFALPTGLLGAGFVEEIQNRKTKTKTQSQPCPHCGKSLDSH